eukprot:5553301-Prymnesium_polylepis.1
MARLGEQRARLPETDIFRTVISSEVENVKNHRNAKADDAILKAAAENEIFSLGGWGWRICLRAEAYGDLKVVCCRRKGAEHCSGEGAAMQCSDGEAHQS